MDEFDYFWYKSNMTGHRSPPAIQTYNLFGESADLPDVVHCETIEARSVLHDWRFETHRHGRLHQIFLIAEGGGEAEMDGRSTAVGPGQFLNVPSGIIHGFAFQPGTVGWVVTISGEMLDEILAPGEGLLPILRQPFVGPAAASLYGVVTRIFEEFTHRDFGRAQALRALCGLLTAEIARGIAAELAPAGQTDTSSLMGRFEALLEARLVDHWSVAQYALALSVTPTHLSRVARATTGQPVSRLIQDRLVREARRYLVYTGLPISAIAYALGFADPAYFSRVFAASTGRSPRTFRAEL
jgi:AraC family transcriptional activator of pobA